MPLISLIIPVYNAQSFLGRCVNSILAQTERNFEVILSDDGSTDNSWALCEQYAKQYPFIKAIHHENRGPAHARNLALVQAEGEYLTFADADDWLAPAFLEELVRTARQYQADLACCNLFLAYENHTKEVPPPLPQGVVLQQTAMYLGITNMGFGSFLCNKLFKRSLFDGFKMKEGTFYEDYDAGIRLLARARRIAYTPKPLYFYFQGNPNSTTHTFSLDKTKDHFHVSQDMADFCAQHPWLQAKKAAQIRLVDVAVSLLHLLCRQKLLAQEAQEVIKIHSVLQKNKRLLLKLRIKKQLFAWTFLALPFLFYRRKK